MNHRTLSFIAVCIAVIAIAGVSLSSCSKDEGYTSRLRELIIDNMQFEAKGGSQTQTFRKEDLTNYEASSDQAWCTATFSSGGLTVTVTTNATYDSRTATVTIKDKRSESTTRTFKVTQSQALAVIVGKTAYEVPATGGNVSIGVKHSIAFTVKLPDVDWITEAKSSRTRALDSTAVVLTVAKNSGGAERKATMSIVNTNSGDSTTVTITQAFSIEFIVNDKELSIDERGGELKVLVKSNVPVKTTFADSWITNGGTEKVNNLYFWQKVKVAAFTDKRASRTSTLTFLNLDYDIYKQVSIVQNRPFYIQAATMTLTEGNTYTVPLYNADKLVAIWESSDPSVATVDAGGTVTAVAAGTVVIKVTSFDKIHTDSINMTIEAKPVTPSDSDDGDDDDGDDDDSGDDDSGDDDSGDDDNGK